MFLDLLILLRLQRRFAEQDYILDKSTGLAYYSVHGHKAYFFFNLREGAAAI